ncbi:MAG: hypothetical protein IT381_18540 [Deltaproteobacteria bacterium]|nr:hypothetical protein [Deltaproteobacteria bacterium]
MCKVACVFGLIFVACAGSQQNEPVALAPKNDVAAPNALPLASYAEQQQQKERDEKKTAEYAAKLKADSEPKAVRVIREFLSSNPSDQRYGIPTYARFQRPWSPTMGSPNVAP